MDFPSFPLFAAAISLANRADCSCPATFADGSGAAATLGLTEGPATGLVTGSWEIQDITGIRSKATTEERSSLFMAAQCSSLVLRRQRKSCVFALNVDELRRQRWLDYENFIETDDR